MEKSDHWKVHAQQWAHHGSPLRPSVDDIRPLESAVNARRPGTVGLGRALLLGVTPEIAHMRWPDGTYLVAADRSMEMIHSIWLPEPPPGGSVSCADWQRLPFGGGCFDSVHGDGCFNALDYRAQYGSVARELRRVLVPGGIFTLRAFLRPQVSEQPEQVFADLHAGRIAGFHAFKWRLAQSLHGSIEQGIPVARIWEAWHAAGVDVKALAARTGWSEGTIATIDVYRGAPAVYTFPTLPELRAAVEGIFTELDCQFGGYELGERCPTLIYQAA